MKIVKKTVRGTVGPTNERMGPGGNGAGDLGQVSVHRRRFDEGQDQPCRNAARRADGSEQIGPLIAGVAGRTGPGAAPGPDAGEGSHLHFNDIRGTAITLLAEAGATVPQIVSITGHTMQSATRILERYLSMRPALSKAAMTAFENASATVFANQLQTRPAQA